MKWMIASDLHGSALYCEKLLNRFHEEHAQKLLLLGDILYHGPRNDLPDGYAPKKVVSLLNGIKSDILCVCGNCDAPVDRMVLEFPMIEGYAVITYGELTLYAIHGHLTDAAHIPPMQPRDILLFGHTHVRECAIRGANLWLNPGSVSIPKNGCYRGYMTLESNRFCWKDLDGTVKNQYEIDSSRLL